MTCIELADLKEFPGRKLEDFPKAEDYFEGIYAYDEEETETMCEYLNNKQKRRDAE